jgi:hypothetical protein
MKKGENEAVNVVEGLQLGDNDITWTVQHKDYSCVTNAKTVTIKNLKAGTAELESKAEQWVCVADDGTVTIDAKAAPNGVTGTWTASVAIPNSVNIHNKSITLYPGLGVSTFTWTISRDGQTDQACTDSKTVTIHNNYVKAEVEGEEFVSCDGNVELRAIDVTKTKYGANAIGY